MVCYSYILVNSILKEAEISSNKPEILVNRINLENMKRPFMELIFIL